MADVATLGFAVDSKPIVGATVALDGLGTKVKITTAEVAQFTRTLGLSETQVKKIEAEAKKAGVSFTEMAERLKATNSHLVNFNKHANDNVTGLTKMSRAVDVASGVATGGGLRGLATGLMMLGPAGNIAGVAILSVAGAATAGVAAFKTWEEHNLVLERMLIATGGAAGRTKEQIEELAEDIGSIQDVRKAATELLKFGNISGEVFDKTLRAADDLSAVGFGSIASSAEALGKALESPTEGLTRLRRAGIIFTDAQIAMVKHLDETGQRAKAQLFIHDELAKKIGGAGAAKDQGLAGAFEKLSDATLKMTERWGKAVVEGTGLINLVNRLAAGIKNMNKEAADPSAGIAARVASARATLEGLEGTGGSIAAQARRRATEALNKALAEQAEQDRKVAQATKETQKATEDATAAAKKRQEEDLKLTIQLLEIETEALRKNARERAVADEMKKLKMAPDDPGKAALDAAVNYKLATEAIEAFSDSTKTSTMGLDVQAKTLTMTAGAAAKFKLEQDLLNSLMLKGVTITADQRKEISDLATAFGRATQNLENSNQAITNRQRLLSGSQGLEMARLELQMVGRTQEEQERLTAQLRIKHQLEQEAAQKNSTVDQAHLTALQQQAAEQAKLNELTRNYTQVVNSMSSAFSTFVSDLSKGVSLMDALSTAANSIGKTFMDMASKRIFESLFSGGGGGSILSGGGGGGGVNLNNIFAQAIPSIGTWGTGGFNGRFLGEMMKGAEVISESGDEFAGSTKGAGDEFGTEVVGSGNNFGGIVSGVAQGLGNALSSVFSGSKLTSFGGGGPIDQGPVQGGGGLAGLFGGGMGGNLALMGIGVGISMISNMIQKKKQAEEEAKRAREVWNGMHGDFMIFLDKMAGAVTGRFGKAVNSAQREMEQFTRAAAAAKDFGAVAQAQQAFNVFREDQARRFFSTFDQLRAAYAGGNKALADAIISVDSFSEEVRGFVGDTKMFGKLFLDADTAADQLFAAQEAAQKFTLSMLAVTPAMDEISKQAFELQAMASGLTQILIELGMSAEEAGRAVQSQLTAAIRQFDDMLNRDINAQMGFGWLNQINDILAKFNSISATGMASPDTLMTWLKGSLQEVVNQAELTGDAFQRLITGMPQLTGLIHEFSDVVVMSAREIAEQAQLLQDRLFAATNDTSTLAGALAAFERSAASERLTTAPENILLLEQVLAVERLNIIKDFNKRALDQQRQVLEEQKRLFEDARQFLVNFGNSIDQWMNNYLGGSGSPLAPMAAFQQAQSAYQAQFALTQTASGQELRDALNSITSYATTYLDAAKSFFGSSAEFGAISGTVTGEVGGLPSAIRPEDLIVQAINSSTTDITGSVLTMQQALTTVLNTGNLDAIRGSLATYLPDIDTNTDAGITFQELQNALGATYNVGTLRGIFNELDGNGNGMIERTELIKNQTLATQTNTGNTATSNADLLTEVSTQSTTLEALAQISSATSATVSNTNILPTIREDTNSMNTQLIAIRNAINAANTTRKVTNPFINDPVAAFHTGGLVGANDNMMAVLQRGEFVMQRSAVRALGVNAMSEINRTGRLGGLDALITEIRLLRQQNNQVTMAAAKHVSDPLSSIAVNTKREAKARRRSAAI